MGNVLLKAAFAQKNHWAKMRHNRKVVGKSDRQPQTNWTKNNQKSTPAQPNIYKNQYQKYIHVQNQLEDSFKKMPFYTMEKHRKKVLSDWGIHHTGHNITKQKRCTKPKSQGGHRCRGKYTPLTCIPADVSGMGRPEWITSPQHNTNRNDSTDSLQRIQYPTTRIHTDSMCLQEWMKMHQILCCGLQET